METHLQQDRRRDFRLGAWLAAAILFLAGTLGVLGGVQAFRDIAAAATELKSVTVSAPNVTELHYRWRNDDGGEQTAALAWATTSVSGVAVEIKGVAIDAQYLYAVGQGNNFGYMLFQKRDLSDGVLVWATTTVITNNEQAVDIAIDGDSMYVFGDNDNAIWYTQKRALSTGASAYLVSSTGGVSGSGFGSKKIAIDSTAMYLSGTLGTATDPYWRIEKRNLSDGALVTAFASSGLLRVGSSTTQNGLPIALDVAGGYLYGFGEIVVGGSPGLYVEKRTLSDGSLVYQTTTIDMIESWSLALDVSDGAIYLGGVGANNNTDWRLEKRSLADGALIWGVSSNLSAGVNRPRGIAVDHTYLYAAGSQNNEAIWRVEKRKLFDGTLMYATTTNQSGGRDFAQDIAIDGQYLYAGGNRTNEGIANFEKRTLGHDTSTATFAATEDNPLLELSAGTLTRLRMMVQNSGDTSAASSLYRLEYATSTVGPWTRVGSPASSTAHWIMASSSYMTDEQGTHDIAGLTDPTSTPAAWFSGQFRMSASQSTLTSTLGTSQFTEYEYAMKSTGQAQVDIPYYFRLTNQGASLTTYSTYASTTLTATGMSVSGVTLNNASSIVLIANATETVTVNFTVSGGSGGCGNIFYSGGNVTTTLYRSGVSSTCGVADPGGNQNALNCYMVATTTHNCASADSTAAANATSTFDVWYFADATDSSSTYPSENWSASVFVWNASGTTANETSTGQALLTLLALQLTTSSINYGTLSASSTSGAINQVTTSTNAGNSSTTIRLSTAATLFAPTPVDFGLASDTTQTYATSSFTFQGLSAFLTLTPTDVAGFLLTSPTSTTNVAQSIYWGITIPAGTPTGTYSGVNAFTAVFSP